MKMSHTRSSSRARLAISRWLSVALAALLSVPSAELAVPWAWAAAAAAPAALIEVNTTGDADDVSPGDAVCDSDAGIPGAQCTLSPQGVRQLGRVCPADHPSLVRGQVG